MGQAIVKCPECGGEVLVQQPGQCVAAAYVTIGYANGDAVHKLHRAIETIDAVAGEMPYRDELAQVAALLRQVDAELVAFADW